MVLFDVVIIGAGPAGLFAAQQAGKQGLSVIVLEKKAAPGKKLLLTGSGQCNFTNQRPWPEFINCYGEHGRFLKTALYHFTNNDSIRFFQDLGIASITVPENQKVFPKSKQAQDILDGLLRACQLSHVQIQYQQAVKAIQKPAAGIFEISCATKTFSGKYVILAAGGMSYPATGSNGDGYRLAQALGHTLTPLKPGLAPFSIKNFSLASLAGSSFKNLALTLWQGDKKAKTLKHDLVITHQGISGPVVQHMARYANPGDKLTLDFLAQKNPDQSRNLWLADMDHNGKSQAATWLRRFSPTQALGDKILELSQVSPHERLAQLSKTKRLELFAWLQAFPMEIARIGNFEIAMVTCGGVALHEVNAKTMESRVVSGVYLTGEVLDIDGDTGGYDLQACWSTAALAAEHIGKRRMRL